MSLFRLHGEFCASHPWEVIVATFTLTACFLSIESVHQKPAINQDFAQEFSPVDAISMTIVRCVAVLYSYYQFRNLHKLGSKYILGIAGLFTVFSSFVFSTSVINYLTGDLSDLKDALFCFLLLIDLSKATLLAQFALSASTTEQVKLNIAKGMSHLGPSLTLDTIVETLVISVGTLSGIRRLETLCYFACVSVVVNYVVFMTFYPSCLSLILELSRNDNSETPSWHHSFKVITELKEHEQKPNPVLERVKVIMSGGLVFVHLHSRWLIRDIEEKESVIPLISPENTMQLDSNQNYILHWIALSADHIVVLILLLALTVKFIFFEDKEEIVLSETLTTSMQSSTNNKKYLYDKIVQTEALSPVFYTKVNKSSPNDITDNRSFEDCLFLYKIKESAEGLSDQEVSLLVNKGIISVYQLEKVLKNPERGVEIRRHVLGTKYGLSEALTNLPYKNYNYSKVMGACCENVIGYVPVPVGLAGPLLLDGKHVIIPMATTEGCLVASANRGCRALSSSGVTTRIVADGMTRGPVVRFPSAARASQAMLWIQDELNFIKIKESFDSTSRFARLKRVQSRIAGRHLFLRFVATTGDAMGMNMISKATECALLYVRKFFPDMELLSLSGNFCSDKKPAAVNWIEGRGKSVVCEAIVNKEIVKSVLKTSVQALVDVNISKNLIGSAVAGSIGGNNAHAANIVTAIFIATGQDPAQNVGSSNCITLMESWGPEEDLYISCTMPSIEIGTVGGGTQLEGQSACLDIVGARGPHLECPGENANKLARIVCAGVLAGELSLMSALASGGLVESHLRHNRSNVVQCQSS